MIHLIKYCLIGFENTLITLVVSWILYELLHWNLELSNLLGFVAGGVNSYLMNRVWNFKSHAKKGKEIFRFVVVFLCAYLVNLFVLEWAKDVITVNLEFFRSGYLANILANGAYVVVSFLMYRFWVFR